MTLDKEKLAQMEQEFHSVSEPDRWPQFLSWARVNVPILIQAAKQGVEAQIDNDRLKVDSQNLHTLIHDYNNQCQKEAFLPASFWQSLFDKPPSTWGLKGSER